MNKGIFIRLEAKTGTERAGSFAAETGTLTTGHDRFDPFLSRPSGASMKG
jgi:hypothetical protein